MQVALWAVSVCLTACYEPCFAHAEYNHLLASQLDSQRAYYEGLLAQQVGGKQARSTVQQPILSSS
jgi:hypothetical protein